MASISGSKELDNDNDEMLEKSPCGRWEKYKKQLGSGEIPGIDTAFMAMDTEKGVEVVWNEINFNLDSKEFEGLENYKNSLNKSLTDCLQHYFQPIQKLSHSCLIKFHSFWLCELNKIYKLVFITEYMAGGCLRNVIRKTRANKRRIALKTWKRWCKEILTALNFLHTQNLTFIHGAVGCAALFIQHTGAIKLNVLCADSIRKQIDIIIASNSPITTNNVYNNGHINNQVINTNLINGTNLTLDSTYIDIFNFGLVALEIAVLGLSSNPSTVVSAISNSNNNLNLSSTSNQISQSFCLNCCSNITNEAIDSTLDRLDQIQSDFIKLCLNKNQTIGNQSLSIRLFTHPAIMDVPSLKVLSGHSVVNNQINIELIRKFVEKTHEIIDHDKPVATVYFGIKPENFQVVKSKQNPRFDIEQFLRQIRSGVHPIIPTKLSSNSTINNNATSNNTYTNFISKSPQSYQDTNKQIKYEIYPEAHDDLTKVDASYRKIISTSVSEAFTKSINPSPINVSLYDSDWNISEAKNENILKKNLRSCTQLNIQKSVMKIEETNELASYPLECRRIVSIKCRIQKVMNSFIEDINNFNKNDLKDDFSDDFVKCYMSMQLEFQDKSTQHVSTKLLSSDDGSSIGLDLVKNGLLSSLDSQQLSLIIDYYIKKFYQIN